jgi:hypothetical protein
MKEEIKTLGRENNQIYHDRKITYQHRFCDVEKSNEKFFGTVHLSIENKLSAKTWLLKTETLGSVHRCADFALTATQDVATSKWRLG